MNRIDIAHPYFELVECHDTGCVVRLNPDFPLRSFRLAVVERPSDLIELAADIGFKHEDGEVDWIQGCGTTVEEACMDALQTFLNLVVHPAGLSNLLVTRAEIT